ncbi:MAG: type II secretion system protein [Patescibacteria group bacterium]
MKKYTRGFTLIELLVVIAIIGILSSVVLVSLNSARGKGKASRAQQEAVQIRTQFETNYTGSKYPDLNNTVYAGGPETFTVAPWITSGNLYVLYNDIVANQGAGLKIYSSGTSPNIAAYAIYLLYNNSQNGGYCVDSTGNTVNYTTGTAFSVASNASACAASL